MRNLVFLVLVLSSFFLMHRGIAGTSPEIIAATDQLLKGNESEYRKRMYQLSESGDREAQLTFGRFLSHKREYEAAEWWLLHAALKDDLEAQFHLGGMYLQQGSKKADLWLERAASGGHAGAAVLMRFVKRKPRIRGNDFHFGDLLSGVSSLLLYKVQSLRDSAVACYQTDRPTIERIAVESVEACGAELGRGEEWIASERVDGINSEFGQCITREIHRKTATTRDSLVACLRRVDAP